MEILEVGAVYTHTYNRVGASWFEAVRLDRELIHITESALLWFEAVRLDREIGNLV